MIELTLWQLVGVAALAMLVGVGADRAVCGLLALLQETWSGVDARIRAFRGYENERDQRRLERNLYETQLDSLRAELRAAKRTEPLQPTETNPHDPLRRSFRDHLKRQDEPS